MTDIIELCEEEAMMRDEAAYIIVPFSFTYKSSLTIEVYPMFRHIAEKFLKKFGEDEAEIFSDEAISWILENVGKAVSEHGFDISDDSEDYFVTRKILPSDRLTKAVRISSTEGLCNLTDYDIDAMTECGCISFGVIADGKILSVAATNASVDDDTEIMEIGIETAEGHGGHGYGRDAVAALANELSIRGITVHYEYASKNRASEALVSVLDTEIIAKTYYLVGIRE